MPLRAWKVKIEVASVFIMDYRSKGWIPVKISGCYITGSTVVSENVAESLLLHHLLSLVRYVRTQGGQPFQGGATRNMPLLP